MSKFDYKIALVTGGGSGIGRATALKFTSEGASVVIGNRNEKAGQETVNLIKQGIRVNAVCPGATETALLDGLATGDNSTLEYIKSLHPIGRLAKPEEIADVVAWLCCEEASFVLGQEIVIDGGFTAI